MTTTRSSATIRTFLSTVVVIWAFPDPLVTTHVMNPSTTNDTPASQRAPVLKDSSSWDEYISFHRVLAKHAEVWAHIDPDDDTPPTLERPAKPTAPTSAEIIANNVVFDMYKLECANWMVELDHYRQKKDIILHLFNSCLETLHPHYHYLIRNVDTVHARLCLLQTRFKPDEHAREIAIVERFHELTMPPPPGLNRDVAVERWVVAWAHLDETMKKEGIGSIENENPATGFLDACSDITATHAWAAAQANLACETGVWHSLASYIADFRDMWIQKDENDREV